MYHFRALGLGLALFLSISLSGQEWVDKFQNPEKHSFKEIQESFEEYWKDKEVEKGKGFKPFKRWEHYWQDRLMPDGSFPKAGAKLEAYNRFLNSQNSNQERSSVMTANWLPMGPSTTTGGYAGIGRINSVAFHPTNTDIIYAGAAGGGLWQTNDGGDNWVTHTDGLATLGVSGIIVHPSNPNIVYIATGDGDASDNYSVGVLKSTDGGITFNSTGLSWNITNFALIRRMIIDPDNSDAILVASNAGIYRTTDAGNNWTQEQAGNFYDIEPNFDGSSNTFYASTRDQIWVSTDNGDSWTMTTTFSGVNRTGIATTSGNNSYVYALCSNSSNNGFHSFHRSTDNGSTFSQRANSPNLLGWASDGSDTRGQGWYDLALTADPNDANTVYVGGVNTWKSTDGGSNWNLKTHWSGATGVQTVHADKHILEWQGNVLWEGNDGGLYKSTNGGDTWTNRTNGMIISQMYRLGVSESDARVITGLQDNGTKLKGTNGTWTDEIGGDGMDCAIKPTNGSVMYGSLYYGAFRRSTDGGSNWTNITNNMPGDPGGAWVAPFDIAPSQPNTIVAGMDDVFISNDQGDSWTQATSDVGNLSYVAYAPSDVNYLYVGKSGSLMRTTDGGANWSNMTVPTTGVIDLAVHPTDPNTLWAVCSNYSNGQKVYKSTNGGASWSNISGSLPNIPARAVVYQEGTANGIYIGMDVGIYYKDDGMGDWELFNDGLPNVEITDLGINHSDGYIYAASYGRGLWRSELRDQVPACLYPIDGSFSSTSPTTANAFWDFSGASSPTNGYEVIVSNSSTPSGSGTNTTNVTIDLSGLSYNSDTYVHVRSDCGGGEFSGWLTIGPIRGLPSCNDTVYDSGGAGSNYSNNENIITTICPDNTMNRITATFNSFDVESTWDALYVFNGPTTSSPQFDSGNPGTQAGFPAGGFYGTNIPGPFVSTDPSGCITIQFMSDTYVSGSGWTISPTCDLHCPAPAVGNTDDTGWASLRHVITCPLNGNPVVLDASVVGNVIEVTSAPLEIIQLTIIDQSVADKLILQSQITQELFRVNSGQTLHLDQVELRLQPNQVSILNNGSLEINNCEIKGSNSKLQNNNDLMILNNGNLRIEE